jgi:16S rRNA processing protein RimM
LTEEYRSIGKIVGVHGLKGTLKVHHSSGLLEKPQKNLKAHLFRENKLSDTLILNSIPQKNIALIVLESIDSIDLAEPLIGSELLLLKKDFPKIKEKNTYYEFELLGVHPVFKGEVLEKFSIHSIISNPAHSIVLFKDELGGEILVPFIEKYIGQLVPELNGIEVFDWDVWFDSI